MTVAMLNLVSMRPSDRPVQSEDPDLEDMIVCLAQAFIERDCKPDAFYAGCLVQVAAWHDVLPTTLHKIILQIVTLGHEDILAQFNEVKGRRGQKLSETDD